MCDITSGRDKQCKNSIGGLGSLFLFNFVENPFTVASGVATAINPELTEVFEYKIEGDGNNVSESYVSDRNFLRDYHFNYLAYTVSKINADFINKRNYFGIKSIRFQELESANHEKNSPLILPSINSHFETKPLFFKEKLILDTNY